MQGHKTCRFGRSWRISILTAFLALLPLAAVGAIPEPDAIIWGELTTAEDFPAPPGTVVKAVHVGTGAELASYTIDHTSPAGFAFVLRVPLAFPQDGGSTAPGTAEVGDAVDLRVDGQTLVEGVPLSERGLIERVQYNGISMADSDGDGIPDLYETGTGSYGGKNDTGTNPNVRDSDGDGIWDGTEVAFGSDPTDAESVALFPGAGDVDQNGVVDIGDALLLERYLMGGPGAPSIDPTAADLAPVAGPNDSIDLGDLVLLMRVVAGEVHVASP